MQSRLALLVLLTFSTLTACQPRVDESGPGHVTPEEVQVDHTDSPDTPPLPFSPTTGAVLLADHEHGLFAYWIMLGDDVYVAVWNESAKAHSTRFPKPREGHYEVAFLTDEHESYRLQTDATGIIVEISARSGMILRRTDG